ncbi:hypothetical protein AB0M43_36245 [Longispora sp. NPDC051575]|uniref:hypothetical protein n=1 Tax=Longispora sp. NPDC051575 TaxID=3154943 RepID=UPI00342B358E
MGANAPTMACRTCLDILNTVTAAGSTRYAHAAAADHPADPVPASTIDRPRRLCDFCGTTHLLTFAYTTAGPVSTLKVGGAVNELDHYGTIFRACAACAPRIDARDVDGLARVARAGRRAHPAAEALHRAILDDLRPARALICSTDWTPTPLPARTLPKVRDRLAALLRGADLIAGLPDRSSRSALADGLDRSTLTWANAQASVWARELAQATPAELTVRWEDAPSDAGLLAWAEPNGHDTALSWTVHDGGWQVASYHTVGSGLAGPDLQHLREQVGWLAPSAVTHIRPGQPVTDDPLRCLLAAVWIAVACQAAESVPLKPDPALERTYRRRGQAVPQVRLLRVRPRPARQPTKSSGTGTGLDWKFKTWVSGRYRWVAHGEKHSERRWQAVAGYWLGPEDAPINPHSAVRVLDRVRPVDAPER